MTTTMNGTNGTANGRRIHHPPPGAADLMAEAARSLEGNLYDQSARAREAVAETRRRVESRVRADVRAAEAAAEDLVAFVAREIEQLAASIQRRAARISDEVLGSLSVELSPPSPFDPPGTPMLAPAVEEDNPFPDYVAPTQRQPDSSDEDAGAPGQDDQVDADSPAPARTASRTAGRSRRCRPTRRRCTPPATNGWSRSRPAPTRRRPTPPSRRRSPTWAGRASRSTSRRWSSPSARN